MNTPSSEPSSVARAVAPGRRRGSWGSRLLALAVAPLLFLGLVEGGLRLAGFGHPTTYFVPSKDLAGQWVENPDFGRLFFPAGLLRVPPPTVVAEAKPAGTIRVLIFGESAAMGDPKPAFSVGRYLQVLLSERYPGTRFEVVPVAMTAINSHALVAMARESVRLKADFWVIYAGNNEMLGPFGAGTTLGGQSPSWRWVRWILAARATRLGQAIEALAAKVRTGPAGSSRWAGVRVLAGENVGAEAPGRARVYEAFERNLRDVLEFGRASGARVLASTVAVNLADCGPFGAEPPDGWDDARRSDWRESMTLASRVLTQPAEATALALVSNVAVLAPDHAGVLFLQGRVGLEAGDTTNAVARLAKSRDLDSIPLRADSRLNGITRSVAKEMGVEVLDAEAALAKASARGVPGTESFYEHVHLTPEGNRALALVFAEGIERGLPEAVRAKAAGEWASPETCATRLGLTPWARSAAAEQMLRRCLDAPFTNRLNHIEHIEALAAEVSRQRRAQSPETAALVRGVFETLIASSPEDPHLARTHAEFLEGVGDAARAATEWQRVTRLLPHHPYAYLQAGGILRRAGKTDDARPWIEKAVALQPDWVEARLEVADLALARGRPAEAIAACRVALGLQPDHARAHFRLADALAADRQREAAIKSLEEAVRLDPRLWEARYLLGVEYALADRIAEARTEFEAVVRLKPDHARGHFNLGIALARERQWKLAAQHLSETLRLEPRHEEARRALSQVAAERRKEEEAPAPP